MFQGRDGEILTYSWQQLLNISIPASPSHWVCSADETPVKQDSHLIFVNSLWSTLGRGLCTSPKPSTGTGLVMITQILCFCTKFCLDIQEPTLWLSSNLPWPGGLATHAPLRDPRWESWVRKEPPINVLHYSEWIVHSLRQAIPERAAPGRRCLVKALSEERQRTCSSTKHPKSSLTYLVKFWGLLKILIYWFNLPETEFFTWGPHAWIVHKRPHLYVTFSKHRAFTDTRWA